MTSERSQHGEDDEVVPLAVPIESAKAVSEGITNEAFPEVPRTAISPVPVLLLTGFLGAGKTTLVNYILSARHGYRCAVLLNEIADSADIEKALIREPQGAQPSALANWVQLENGCICCSVKNDMVQALESLLQQRDSFDYIIIETTGLANPGPVAAALWTDAELEAGVCLDAIVTVVDARNILRHLVKEPESPLKSGAAVNEATQQIAFADIILINKIDLVSESHLEHVQHAVRQINSEAVLFCCERCHVDLGRILHTGIYSVSMGGIDDGVESQPTPSENEVACSRCEAFGDGGCSEHGRTHGHAQNLGNTSHSTMVDVRTLTLHVDRPLSIAHLRHWLDELLWEGAAPGAPEIFRVKGLLHIENSDSKWILQAVHEVYDVVEGSPWDEPKSQRRSKLVFIGRCLDARMLAGALEACCLDA